MSAETDLQDLLEAEIPLTRALGLRVQRYDAAGLVLSAPLAPNVNHKRTVFGGSLYSVLVLAGWGWIALRLREAGIGAQIVIHAADIRYLLPVEGDFEAVCTPPPEEDYASFLRILTRRGRARLHLQARVSVAGREAVTFSGAYVVQARP